MRNITSFWKFITDNIIEIPIIQRDYAQGREGKENLRKNFLVDLKKALDKEPPYRDSKMKLDFVYGSKSHDKINPLDGQQRLTTLWLLHWYIALRAGQSVTAFDTLRRFSYETRISSREFCYNMCIPKHFEKFDGDDIVGYITNQTWFFSAWKQDPTIQSMLRMLSGTHNIDKQGNDFVDGIEELFVCPSDCDIVPGRRCFLHRRFKEYWDMLTSDDSPIVFYYLPLQDFGLSDDLYVKMNARGKQLTAFENFKAEIVGYIRKESYDDPEWMKLLDAQEGIPILMDTRWTDLFWLHRSKGIGIKDDQNGDVAYRKCNQIDEIYYAFLNRFFWNELFMAKDTENKYILPIGKGVLPDGTTTNTIETENLSYKHLNEDRYDLYFDLEPYKLFHGEIPQRLFDDLRNVLNRCRDYKKDIPVCEWNKDFRFIPEYETDENSNNIEVKNSSKETYLRVTSLNQVERVAFFAICKYFKEGDGEDVSLKRWMRVVWNLISGIGEDGRPQIRNTTAMRTAMEFIGLLDSHRVYESLIGESVAESVGREKTSEFKSRCLEEMAKARQILTAVDGDAWEKKIVEAENYSFFRGAVRFLYTDAEGRENWDDFPVKWANAQKYFNGENVRKSVLNPNYDGAGLLKALIGHFAIENYRNSLWWNHRTFNNEPQTWLYYLLNDDIFGPVHELMIGNTTVKALCRSDNFEANVLYYLSNTGLLDFVVERIPNSWIRDYHGHKAIFPSGPGVFLDAENRNTLLLKTDGVMLLDDCQVPDTDLLFGSDVNFSYKGKNFRWDRNNYVYRMESENRDEKVVKNNVSADDVDKYYCFDASDISDSLLFCAQLDDLLFD